MSAIRRTLLILILFYLFSLFTCFLSIRVSWNGGIMEGINNGQCLTVYLIVTQNTNKKIWSKNNAYDVSWTVSNNVVNFNAFVISHRKKKWRSRRFCTSRLDFMPVGLLKWCYRWSVPVKVHTSLFLTRFCYLKLLNPFDFL